MKNTVRGKGPITKPLLAGLVIPSLSQPGLAKTEAEKPVSGKPRDSQADLIHDPGNGYNPDFTVIQD